MNAYTHTINHDDGKKTTYTSVYMYGNQRAYMYCDYLGMIVGVHSRAHPSLSMNTCTAIPMLLAWWPVFCGYTFVPLPHKSRIRTTTPEIVCETQHMLSFTLVVVYVFLRLLELYPRRLYSVLGHRNFKKSGGKCFTRHLEP